MRYLLKSTKDESAKRISKIMPARAKLGSIFIKTAHQTRRPKVEPSKK
jgi:hypothetical protein